MNEDEGNNGNIRLSTMVLIAAVVLAILVGYVLVL